jgi:hypothetical protein
MCVRKTWVETSTTHACNGIGRTHVRSQRRCHVTFAARPKAADFASTVWRIRQLDRLTHQAEMEGYE